jgi:Ca2+-binding RTX toxin-like protein
MRRSTLVALLVVAVTLLVVGGVVLAKSITCTGGTCTGTKKADQITGSVVTDTINGRGGGDTIDGGNGDDTINGGGGNDTITYIGVVPDVDTINGGKGNDIIDVREGALNDAQDKVDCGPGTDTIFFDATDFRANCEIFNPN